MTSPNTIIADLTAEVETLRKQRDEWKARAEFSYTERSKLERKINELLAALEELNSASARGFLYDDPARINARKAIALAKGSS